MQKSLAQHDMADESFVFTVGGNLLPLICTLSVADLIGQLCGTGKRVAVQRNGKVLPKSQHTATRFNSGDRFEIVVAVGGR